MAKFIDSVKKKFKNMFPEKIQRKTIESDYVLETENLGISFGGLKAVQDLNLEIHEGQLYGLVGPNGAGKTTVFNMITGVYKPTTGKFWLDGENLTGKKQENINHKGIARTFQNIRLFNNMTVIRNVMVGFHNLPEYKCSFIDSIFRTKRHREVEKAMRERAKEILVRDMESALLLEVPLTVSVSSGKTWYECK